MNNTTFIMAFYNFKGNKRHNLDHYKKHITRTFRIMPKSKIVFFYEDDNIFNLIKRRCKTKTIIGKKILNNDLPTFEITKNYVNSLKKLNIKKMENYSREFEKGKSHYYELKNCGDKVYHQILTIWTSKLFLIEKVINDNPYKTNNFAWVDVSLGKMNDKRNNWNWMTNIYPENKISFYPSKMTYYGTKLNLSAGFIYSEKNYFIKLINLYKIKLEELKDDIYGHDEETILNFIYLDKIKLFNIIN